ILEYRCRLVAVRLSSQYIALLGGSTSDVIPLPLDTVLLFDMLNNKWSRAKWKLPTPMECRNNNEFAAQFSFITRQLIVSTYSNCWICSLDNGLNMVGNWMQLSPP